MTDRTSEVCAGLLVADGDLSDFNRAKDSSTIWKGPVVHMLADWHPAGLGLFDTEAWGNPEVHASAATDVLAGALVSCNDREPPQQTFHRHFLQLNHWQ